mgnify:CR=1 FL=1
MGEVVVGADELEEVTFVDFGFGEWDADDGGGGFLAIFGGILGLAEADEVDLEFFAEVEFQKGFVVEAGGGGE